MELILIIVIIVIIVLLILLRKNELFYNVKGGSPALVDLNIKYNKEYSKIMSGTSKVKINKKYSNKDFNEDELEYYEYPYKCLDYSDILDK